MEDKNLVFLCASCGSKLAVDKEVASKHLHYDVDTWRKEPTGALTMRCFCKGTMTAYTNGADGAFYDDIRNAAEEFGRVIEIAYEAAEAAASAMKKR